MDSGGMPLGAPNWRSPNWPPEAPSRANYRALGLADLASAVLRGSPHRSTGRLALHVLEVMHAILEGAAAGRSVTIGTMLERPPALDEQEAGRLWKGEPRSVSAA